MSLSPTEEGQLQLLLDQISHIDFQYRKAKQEDRFNIFNVLANKFDEVNLHSRFLYELLNPHGTHNCDKVFLEQFLVYFGLHDFRLEKARVRREHQNIDLLITNERQAVIIENKLWAVDQPAQLQRYYEIMNAEGFQDIRIFYLSINGKKPAEYSIGTLRERENIDKLITCISYKADIEQWLERCLKEVYSKPTLRETLVQYRALIWEISGNTMHREEMDDIVELLAKGDNMLKAKKISENWNHARWHTEWYFWRDLEKLIVLEYEISPVQKYSVENINSVVHHRRNQNPWYGILFKIGTYLDADACIFIERGGGSEAVYYGLTMLTGTTKENSGDVRFKPLAEKVSQFSEWFQDTYWIGGNYCKPEINFNEFSQPDTLKLLNDNYRAQYINALWRQMKEFVTKVKQVIAES